MWPVPSLYPTTTRSSQRETWCSPPHSAKPRLLRNFPCSWRAPAWLHNPSWDVDSPRLGPIDRPDQDRGESDKQEGVCHKVCLSLKKTKAVLKWPLKHFWSLLADGLAETFWGKVMLLMCNLCGCAPSYHPDFLLAETKGRSKCTVLHLGSRRNIFQNIICCRASMGAFGCGWGGGGWRLVVLPEPPWYAWAECWPSGCPVHPQCCHRPLHHFTDAVFWMHVSAFMLQNISELCFPFPALFCLNSDLSLSCWCAQPMP